MINGYWSISKILDKKKTKRNKRWKTYSPFCDNSNISYQTRRSWITWTWFVPLILTPVIGLNVWAGIGFEKGNIIVGECVFIVLNKIFF
jgi:hypothetical protein